MSHASMPKWKRVRVDGLVRLYRLFEARPDHPWRMRGHFEAQREVTVAGVPVKLCCAVHVMPVGQSGSPFKTSVTVWVGGRRKVAKDREWRPALVRIGWYAACARELRRNGFSGRWRPSPWGRFGDFWKDLKGSEALVAGVQAAEELMAMEWARIE